jgi:dihydroorotase
MKILIKGGHVVDPASSIDGPLDILIENGQIAKVAGDISETADQVIEAKDKIVLPGLIDMHVHLREPGREDKETVASGTRAALKGGVTSVLAMPNTMPAIDTSENVRFLKKIIQKTAQCHVFIAGAITSARSGETVTDIPELQKLGVVAVTDDGSSVESSEVMREALKRAKECDLLVICHCEDQRLSNSGVMNLGFMSTMLGLRGISKESEYKRVQRDIDLAQETGARVHITHVSCRESVELVAQAKKNGVAVTAETAPHYFSLSEEELIGYDTNFKMNPPLRAKADAQAIKQGLKDGTIDVIASDHAPHTENEKEIEFDRAEFGVVGLETLLSVSITELVETGLLSWQELVTKLALGPAKILGVPKGSLKAGVDADIIIVDPRKEWKVTQESFVSMSKNSAFIGRTLQGAVEYTILSGKIAYRSGKSERRA